MPAVIFEVSAPEFHCSISWNAMAPLSAKYIWPHWKDYILTGVQTASRHGPGVRHWSTEHWVLGLTLA